MRKLWLTAGVTALIIAGIAVVVHGRGNVAGAEATAEAIRLNPVSGIIVDALLDPVLSA